MTVMECIIALAKCDPANVTVGRDNVKFVDSNGDTIMVYKSDEEIRARKMLA